MHTNFGDENCLRYTAFEYGRLGVPKRRHIKFRRRGNHPKEIKQHSEHGESLKSITLK